VLSAGAVGNVVHSYFSPQPIKSTAVVDTPTPTPIVTPTPPPIAHGVVRPLTREELAKLSYEDQQQELMKRNRKLLQQDAEKTVIAQLLHVQNQAVESEMQTDKDIAKQDQLLKRLMKKRTGDQVHDETGATINNNNNDKNSPTPMIDNIDELSDDESNLEGMITEMERDKQKPSVSSQSSNGTPNLKRTRSEPETPSKNNNCEPPLKKAKSNTGTATVIATVAQQAPKRKRNAPKKQKCAICGFEEVRLWATDPKDGKTYCYACHTLTSKRNRCSYKPETGGRPCFRTNEKETALCSEHIFTIQTSVMDVDS